MKQIFSVQITIVSLEDVLSAHFRDWTSFMFQEFHLRLAVDGTQVGKLPFLSCSSFSISCPFFFLSLSQSQLLDSAISSHFASIHSKRFGSLSSYTSHRRLFHHPELSAQLRWNNHPPAHLIHPSSTTLPFIISS